MDPRNGQKTLSKSQRTLLSAVETGTFGEVQKLASETQLLNRVESFDYILLVTALQRGHKTISKYLIKNVCVVKAPVRIRSYFTPLYYAVKMDDIEIFKALLKKGATILDRNDNEDTAIELIMDEHKTTFMDFLLDDIKLPNKSKNLNPDCASDVILFHLACWAGDVAALQIFISHKFSAKSPSTFGKDEWKGFTALHFALVSKSSKLDAVVTLLNHDVDLCAMDGRGRTCLHIGFRSLQYCYLFRSDFILKYMGPHGNQMMNPVDEHGLSHFHILCSIKSSDETFVEHKTLIKSFIDSGVDISSSVSLEHEMFPGFTALHFAGREFSFSVMKLLLEYDADPTKVDLNDLTPLHLICQRQYFDEDIDNKQRSEIVKLLLQHGADPAAKDFEDRTPLHHAFVKFAVVRPLDEFEKLLLSKNSEGINHTDEDGISYLHIACMDGDLSIVETLVSNGAPVNASIQPSSDQYTGYTPLHFAAESNHLEIVEFLLTHGAFVDAVDDRGNTPLHLACRHEDVEQKYGSHKRYRIKNDDVFWLSTRASHIRIVELLIDHGAPVDALNDADCTPLLNNFEIPSILGSSSFWYYNQDYVESLQEEIFYRQQKIMDILLNHGADINVRGYGGSILHTLAIQYNKYLSSKELAEIVLTKGADVNAVSGNGSTPLHIAVDESMRWADGAWMVDVFIKNGADINARDKSLNTPLHTALYDYDYVAVCDDVYASLFNHPEVDVDAQNARKETPLHMAIDQHNHFCIKKLLDIGADINLEDNEGHPPIYYLSKYLEGASDVRRYPEDPQIITTVIVHVKKLMKLKQYVSDTVIHHCDVLSHHPSLIQSVASIDIEIDEEVQRLKSQMLNNYTSLYDILTKGVNIVAKYALNENLKAAATSKQEQESYKYFSDVIRRQYEKGCKRFNVLEPAKKALNFITNQNWPNCCLEEILSNLSDVDLEKLILVVTNVRMYKRSKKKLPTLEAFPVKIPCADE